MSAKEQFKIVVKEYGKVALLSHSTIWAGSLAATYAVLRAMDMDSILAMLPHSIASHIDPSAGAFAVAFVITKLTGPFRLMIDVAIAPTLAAYLRHTPLAGPLGLRRPEEMAAAAAERAAKQGESPAKQDSYRAVQRLVAPMADEGRQALSKRARYAVTDARARWARLRTAAGLPPAGGDGVERGAAGGASPAGERAHPRAGEGAH